MKSFSGLLGRLNMFAPPAETTPGDSFIPSALHPQNTVPAHPPAPCPHKESCAQIELKICF